MAHLCSCDVKGEEKGVWEWVLSGYMGLYLSNKSKERSSTILRFVCRILNPYTTMF